MSDGKDEQSEARQRALSTLLRAPGLGPRRSRQLLEEYGNAEAVIAAPRRALAAAGVPRDALRWLGAPDKAAIADDLAWAQAPDHHLIVWGEAAYPQLLAGIEDAPIALFIVGDPALLCAPQVAIVGSRNPTPTGREIAGEFAAFLAGAGFVVTSGMALGIDGAAHAGALDAGGKTVAVMGTGPDRIYPKRHLELAERISAAGALATEFP
ncbi:MAG: DNA-processing protein DprA, partial [Gammaproteobacteria bacterium]